MEHKQDNINKQSASTSFFHFIVIVLWVVNYCSSRYYIQTKKQILHKNKARLNVNLFNKSMQLYNRKRIKRGRRTIKNDRNNIRDFLRFDAEV